VGELDLQQRTGALVLAVRRGAGLPFEPHPPDDLVLPAGSVLIALGTESELDSLAQLTSR
jgi:uncharacterized protein with PhoU and TrkA domain